MKSVVVIVFDDDDSSSGGGCCWLIGEQKTGKMKAFSIKNRFNLAENIYTDLI